MANPTSNFGWVMPTSTDLVTDLPADFAVFGQAVDTSMADLKGGTTGQILSKTTNADMDFTWVTSAGDIEGVTAGIGISGGGTTGTVTITNSMATAIDAKGDLVVGTGADTFSRLAVGTNNQVLVADSTAATGVKWAAASSGSQTSIATGSFSGSSFTISSIPSTYRDLKLVLVDFALSNASMLMTVNSQTGVYKETSSYLGASSMTSTNMEIVSPFVSNNNMAVVTIAEYANARFHAVISTYVAAGVTAPNYTFGIRPWFMNYSSAISSITISSGSGSFSGGTYTLYGVN